MTRTLKALAKAACQRGAWHTAACDAYDEGREVIWFAERERALVIAARRAELAAA